MPIDWNELYLCGLIFAGTATLLYALFGDVVDSLHASPNLFLSPISFLSLLAILSGFGLILQKTTTLGHAAIFVISLGIAVVIVGLLTLFVLVPLSKSEQSTSVRMQDFEKGVGEVIIEIPKEGFGEVLFRRVMGSQNLPAQSATKKLIPQGTQVYVHRIENGVAFVSEKGEE